MTPSLFALDDDVIEPSQVALFSPNQPRASNGRWTTGGGGSVRTEAVRGGASNLPDSVKKELARKGIIVPGGPAPARPASRPTTPPRPAPKATTPPATTPPAQPVAPKPAPPKATKPKEQRSEDMPPGEAKARKKLQEFEDRVRSHGSESGLLLDPLTGQTFVEKRGAKNSVSWDWREQMMMPGRILSHNHPNGSAFSPQDFGVAASRGLSEIRAIGRFGHDHSLKPGKDGWPDRGTQQRIMSDVNRGFRVHADRLRSDVQNGRTSSERAWIEASHQAWLDASRRYPGAFIYNRTYNAANDPANQATPPTRRTGTRR